MIPVGLDDIRTGDNEKEKRKRKTVAAGAVARENVTVLKALALNPASHGAKTFKPATTNHVSWTHIPVQQFPASPPCVCAISTVRAYFPPNSLHSTDRKYTST